MDIESRVLEIIRGERKAPIAMAGLAALSGVYRTLIAARNFAYDRSFLPATALSVPVVSVGNVVVGGTGKTPLVHLLALHLQEKARLAILTRGFSSQIERRGEIKLITQGAGPLFSAEECGDEPYFLAQKTKATIWVGADRIASGQRAIAQGANCILLDDGMQHRRLKRDVEIVVINAQEPFSKGRFLPWGLLRDAPQRLKNASLVVATHVRGQADRQRLEELLKPLTAAPLVGMRAEVVNLNAFPSKVGVFCGIGQPERFLQTVRDLKSEIVDTFFVKDHATIAPEQLQAFAERCRAKGAGALVCTEKDQVKLSSQHACCLPLIPIEMRFQAIFGEEHWERCIENILDRIEK